MLNLEVGDAIDSFFDGDYWIEEIWHCDENVGPQRLERFEPSLILTN